MVLGSAAWAMTPEKSIVCKAETANERILEIDVQMKVILIKDVRI